MKFNPSPLEGVFVIEQERRGTPPAHVVGSKLPLVQLTQS